MESRAIHQYELGRNRIRKEECYFAGRSCKGSLAGYSSQYSLSIAYDWKNNCETRRAVILQFERGNYDQIRLADLGCR